jgi:hypothetical protein
VLDARTCWTNRKRRGERESKRALEESIPNDEKYPSEDLREWIKNGNGGQLTKKVERGGECNEREKEEHGLAK